MKAEQHVWKTADGRFVLAGDPDAAVLAYATGDQLPDEVVAELTGDTKQVRPAANKARSKPADK